MSHVLSAWVGVDDHAHVAVSAAGDPAAAAKESVPSLVSRSIASKIAHQDPTLWGPDAVDEARIRLGWTRLHESAREIHGQLTDLAAELKAEGKTSVVLAGMGGSSLGPEVICKTYGVPLICLDSTDPDQVNQALSGDLSATVLVVSSKSGSTVETDSARRAFEAAFEAAGLEAREHIVVVTDPGSPLHDFSVDAGYRAVFLADPNVGGRFSVLSAFGVVPSALAGVPVAELWDEAEAVAASLAEDHESNPALLLGAAMATPGRSTLVISDHGSGLEGFGDWAEQLIAESTGKDGVGVLPVVAEADAPDRSLADVIDCRLVSLDSDDDPEGHALMVAGTLGAQFLLWEYATAIAGVLLEINPFDQPNVESAKTASRALLEQMPEPEPALLVDNGIEVRATRGLVDHVTTVDDALAALENAVGPEGYLAVMAYLNRERFPELAATRAATARRVARPVTFGWGPRFLHSTGQLHKGGPAVGAFVQITGELGTDVPIPGRPFTFAQLIGAQAAGDAQVLADCGVPVLRLHLTDPDQVPRIVALLER